MPLPWLWGRGERSEEEGRVFLIRILNKSAEIDRRFRVFGATKSP